MSFCLPVPHLSWAQLFIYRNSDKQGQSENRLHERLLDATPPANPCDSISCAEAVSTQRGGGHFSSGPPSLPVRLHTAHHHCLCVCVAALIDQNGSLSVPDLLPSKRLVHVEPDPRSQPAFTFHALCAACSLNGTLLCSCAGK